MPQLFPRGMNVAVRVGLLSTFLALGLLVWAGLQYTRSSYGTGVQVTHEQPIPFSHQHHVGGLGIDCRYCHTSVEQSSFAGIPPTKTCMNCHSQIWLRSAPLVEPIRESYRTNQSIPWQRVYNLPGFVYFDHSIHVQKGIGCASCHGRIDQMPLTQQVPPLLMEWCLECHRNPEKRLRPREAVFVMPYQPPDNQLELGEKLKEEYHIRTDKELTSCTICHR